LLLLSLLVLVLLVLLMLLVLLLAHGYWLNSVKFKDENI